MSELTLIEDEEAFESFIDDGGRVVVFGAPDCQPCEGLKKELSGKLDGFGYVNVNDADADLVSRFTILGLPTTIVVEDGGDVTMFVGGNTTDEILEALR